MASVIPIPEERKDRLDRCRFLLSRRCSNIGFFLSNHRDDVTCLDDPVFVRLFTEAESAAMDYKREFYLTVNDLLGKGVWKHVKVGSEHENNHVNLIVTK